MAKVRAMAIEMELAEGERLDPSVMIAMLDAVFGSVDSDSGWLDEDRYEPVEEPADGMAD